MVVCLWEQRVATAIEHRVVPDGCADVIAGFGFSGAVAVGLADRPLVHHLPGGSVLRGLRLRPEAVATFFGVPAAELRNRSVTLDEVVGSGRASRLVDLVLDGRPDNALTAQPPEPVRRAFHLLRGMSVDAQPPNSVFHLVICGGSSSSTAASLPRPTSAWSACASFWPTRGRSHRPP